MKSAWKVARKAAAKATATKRVAIDKDISGIAFSDGCFHPKSEEEIRRLVSYCYKKNQDSDSDLKWKLRVRGSRHSYFTGGDYTPAPSNVDMSLSVGKIFAGKEIPYKGEQLTPGAVNIMLDKFANITDPIESAEEVRRQKKVAQQYDPEMYTLVRCEAGVHLGENTTEQEWATWERSLNYNIFLKGWALDDVGGITKQTVSGYLMTGSSGGTTQFSAENNIFAIEFIDGTARKWKVGRDDDPNGTEEARSKNGPLNEAAERWERFQAVGVSMGLLGVITHVTFKVHPTYMVNGVDAAVPYDNHHFDAFGDGKVGIYGERIPSLKEFILKHDFCRIMWYPHNPLLGSKVMPEREKPVGEKVTDIGFGPGAPMFDTLVSTKCYEDPAMSQQTNFPSTWDPPLSPCTPGAELPPLHKRYTNPNQFPVSMPYNQNKRTGKVQGVPNHWDRITPYTQFSKELTMAAALFFTLLGNEEFYKNGGDMNEKLESFKKMVNDPRLYDRNTRRRMISILVDAAEAQAEPTPKGNRILEAIKAIEEKGELEALLSLIVSKKRVPNEYFKPLMDMLGSPEMVLQSISFMATMPPNPFYDYWWRSLPMDNQIDDSLFPVWFTELWIDIDDVQAVMNDLLSYFEGAKKTSLANYAEIDRMTIERCGQFNTELYAAKASSLFWLSPSYGKTNKIRVDLMYLPNTSTNDPLPFFQGFWDILAKYNYRPHWGKFLPQPHGKGDKKVGSYLDYKALYPGIVDPKNPTGKKINSLECWLEIRKKLDPTDMFLTDYWKTMLNVDGTNCKSA